MITNEDSRRGICLQRRGTVSSFIFTRDRVCAGINYEQGGGMRDDPAESGWLRPWLSRRAAGGSFKLLRARETINWRSL